MAGNLVVKVLGIDFGLKRVGCAFVDTTVRLAYPLPVIQRTTRQKMFEELQNIVQKQEARLVVVGLPLGLDGQETETSRQVRNFTASLARRLGENIQIHLVDERFSSLEAESQLREAGTKLKKIKKSLDSQAAVIILNTWLSNQKT